MVIYGGELKSLAEVTKIVWKMAHSDELSLVIKKHASERMVERGITTLDIIHVLKTGHVEERQEESTVPNLYKYVMVGNSVQETFRSLKLVIIPDEKRCGVKIDIISVMWRDENSFRSL